MSWFYLVLAGLIEVAFAYALKQSEGFTKLVPSLATLALLAASLGFLSLALKALPLGTAYAVWTGVGAIGTVVIGMILLGEPKDLPRIACLALIATGLIGLKLLSPV